MKRPEAGTINYLKHLNSHKGEALGKALSRKYSAFPQSYKDEVTAGYSDCRYRKA